MTTFLIADDSEEKTIFLRSILKLADWDGEVLTAGTTEEAKAMIDAHPEIVAAFIDYYIPSENGPAVIQYLKKRCPTSRIALVSSAESAENSEEARSAGAEAVVCTSHPVPVVEKTLIELLKQWIKPPVNRV